MGLMSMSRCRLFSPSHADCSPRAMPHEPHEPRSGRDDDVRPTADNTTKSAGKPPRSVLVALFGALVPLLAALTLLAPPAAARTEAVPTATLTEVTGFGTNPS